MLAMMAEAGIDFETAYDPADRLGVFFRRETQEALIKEAVWERIPEHRRPESRTVLRSAVVALPPRYFGDVVNRTEFVFEDTVPALGLKGRSGRNHDCQA